MKAVLDLMYEYQLPLGLEYVDREAVQRPLKLKLNNKPVREILQMIVGQLPQYEISFSQGVVETYSPKARTDPTNPLNVFIDNFEVSDQSPRVASTELYGTVAVKLHQPGGLIGDVLDSGHPRNVTLHLQRKRVYQLLNAIVAQNGESLWASTVPPEKLSKLDGSPWQVYGLGPGWEEIILGELQRLFPRQK